MVKFYASAKFAVDTKNDLKLIFQCGIGVYHKLNEENVMHSAGHRKIVNNIKRFVRILLKLPTKKISRKHTSKISKEKDLSFMSSSLILENHFYRIKSPSFECYYFYYART